MCKVELRDKKLLIICLADEKCSYKTPIYDVGYRFLMDLMLGVAQRVSPSAVVEIISILGLFTQFKIGIFYSLTIRILDVISTITKFLGKLYFIII